MKDLPIGKRPSWAVAVSKSLRTAVNGSTEVFERLSTLSEGAPEAERALRRLFGTLVQEMNALIEPYGIESIPAPIELEKESSDLEDLTILYIDDNALNRRVAETIFEDCRSRLVLASSGAEALVLLEERDFDAVLMDIEMPDMDGYETARRIRLYKRGMALPIIAVSANADPESKIKAHATGMDAFVEKPVNPNKLYTAIRDAIVSRGQASKALDRGEALLRFGGDEKAMNDALMQFSQDYGDSFATIEDAFAAKDLERSHFLAHTLKGAAGIVGATRLFKAAKAFDDAVRRADRQKAEGLIAPLGSEFEAAFTEILDYCEAIRSREPVDEELESLPAADSPMDQTPTGLPAALERIHALAGLGDAEAADAFEASKPLFATLGLATETEALAKALSLYDFTEARERVESIARQKGVGFRNGDASRG